MNRLYTAQFMTLISSGIAQNDNHMLLGLNDVENESEKVHTISSHLKISITESSSIIVRRMEFQRQAYLLLLLLLLLSLLRRNGCHEAHYPWHPAGGEVVYILLRSRATCESWISTLRYAVPLAYLMTCEGRYFL